MLELLRATALWPLALALAAVVLATSLHLRFWVRRLRVRLPYALVERIGTEDGSAIELRRVEPVGEPSDAPPVLLVHGLAVNHRNHDLDEKRSLARHLARAGRDVWLVRLRSGRSDRTRREKVSFARMVEHDVPLAVREVLRRTGALHVDYVGFSMGGMLAYACLGRTVPEDSVRRVAIIGSPGLVQPPVRLLRVLRFLPDALVPGLNLRFQARLFAFASEWLVTPMHAVVANARNLERGVTRLALVNAIEGVPARLQADFKRWAFGDGEIRVGQARVLDGLARISRPVLFVAGKADRLAPPPSVRHAHDAWGRDAPDVHKELRVLGRAEGASADYGHGDLACGRAVAAEVFEPVRAFLA